MAGLKAAKTSASTLYVTCSIEPAENDGVIDQVLANVNKELKKGARWSIRIGFKALTRGLEFEWILQQDWAERTMHGWIVLPDHPNDGKWDPLFFTMLTKVQIPKA